MKKLVSLFFAGVVLVSTMSVSSAAPAANSSQNAETKTKKVARKTWEHSKKTTHKAISGGHKITRKTAKGTRWTAHKTKRGTKRIFHKVKSAVQ